MKKLIIIGTGLTMASFLAGCQEQQINYEGNLMPESEAEERIADQLEVENPELDLEVNIAPESDD